MARSHVNLPSVLESVGRSEEAIGILREGVEITGAWGCWSPRHGCGAISPSR
ncbi:hypothetical protein ID867_09785 [Streptomyces parvulus]|nr:hypothetical protein [Streptomyces parvulus]